MQYRHDKEDARRNAVQTQFDQMSSRVRENNESCQLEMQDNFVRIDISPITRARRLWSDEEKFAKSPRISLLRYITMIFPAGNIGLVRSFTSSAYLPYTHDDTIERQNTLGMDQVARNAAGNFVSKTIRSVTIKLAFDAHELLISSGQPPAQAGKKPSGPPTAYQPDDSLSGVNYSQLRSPQRSLREKGKGASGGTQPRQRKSRRPTNRVRP